MKNQMCFHRARYVCYSHPPPHEPAIGWRLSEPESSSETYMLWRDGAWAEVVLDPSADVRRGGMACSPITLLPSITLPYLVTEHDKNGVVRA